jgi:aldehyde dehydrogenase (NAD+)
MMETWHPLGVVGVISAFNFPVAVWAWNTALALVCGNAVVWKPSEKASLSALAAHSLLERAIIRFNAEGGAAPAGLTTVLIGGRTLGEVLVDSPKVALVSATGSTRMGREVGPRVAARFGRSLLELGGNNAAIVAPTANLDLTLRGVAFAAMGTAGQRCTTLRRLFLHDSLYDDFLPRLKAAPTSSRSAGSRPRNSSGRRKARSRKRLLTDRTSTVTAEPPIAPRGAGSSVLPPAPCVAWAKPVML